MKILTNKIKGSLAAVFSLLIVVSMLTTSCEKNDKDNAEPIVPGSTSIRLVHSSEMSASSPLNLFVDGVKVTDQNVIYPLASSYFAVASGTSRKIEVKNGTNVISDTTITIRDGHQYSVFVKELKSGVYNDSGSLLEEKEIKKLIVTDDNNTSAPAAENAKVRFVNVATTGNAIRAAGGTKGATFMRVNQPGPYPNVEYYTYNLADIGSDFVTMRTGPVVFRGAVLNYATVPANVNVDMAETTLEAGKLYTVYLTGSPGGSFNNVIIPSTMELKIIPVN